MLSYAAVRGEEVLPVNGEVDVRLSLLALLEGKRDKGEICLKRENRQESEERGERREGKGGEGKGVEGKGVEGK